MPLSQNQLIELAREVLVYRKAPRPVACLAKVRRTLRTSIVTVVGSRIPGLYERQDYVVEEFLDSPPQRGWRQSMVDVTDFGEATFITLTVAEVSLL